MSKRELQGVENAEAAAIEKLVRASPTTINGYSYRDLLLMALHKDAIEGQLVMYVDKLDAFCESLHEVLAGNLLFLRPVLFYEKVMTEFPGKNPEIAEFLLDKNSPWTYLEGRESPLSISVERYALLNRPHTSGSVMVDTDFPFYNVWRKMVIDRGGEEGLRWLTEQQEIP